MQNEMPIPIRGNYNEIWRDFKISLFNSYTKEKWRQELIDINSDFYEFIRDDVENLFCATGGYLLYLDFESIFKLATEITASQVQKNISKNKKCFFERNNINTLDKYYLVIQRMCNNCKNVFDVNRKINVVFLQTILIHGIYENYEVDFSVLDIEKLSKNEPSKLIFAINGLLNNFELETDELIEICQKYNISISNFSSFYFSFEFDCLKKLPTNQIIIDFESEVA